MPRQFGHCLVQNALSRHSATVIVLHGLGDTGEGLSFMGPVMDFRHVKFLYPTAPTRPMTLSGGLSMPGWFDLETLNNVDKMLAGGLDHEGIGESVNYVKELIAKESESGIPPGRIILLGFSQGGHIALKATLQSGAPIAGCVALSTWMDPVNSEVPEAIKNVPIFVGHGDADTVIPCMLGAVTATTLGKAGCKNVQFKQYSGMAHSAGPEELQDVRAFLLKLIPDDVGRRPSREEIDKMSVRSLMQFLTSKGVPVTGLVEKQELIDKAKSLL